MAKNKTNFVCNNCGGTTAKMMGKCPHCGSWNSIEEQMIEKEIVSSNRFAGMTKLNSKVQDLSEVDPSAYMRTVIGIDELDRVFGGGLVDGSVVLLGGDPGIGKSTLLLQAVSKLIKQNSVLYVSGEESIEQIALRAKRLELEVKGVKIYGEIELEKIQSEVMKNKYKYVIIDSIQTIFSSLLTSAPGSVSQVKECATHLNRMAKENGTTLIMICHVTKEGELAGPRALEHIVDTVLYFEGDKNNQYRMIRATKNRFGALNEVGMFAMTEQGLEEVKDPAGIFLSETQNLPGSAIYVTQEGNRSIMVELQALMDETSMPNPIRRSIGFDLNRLQMLCAVVHKFIDMPIYTQNVFVSLIGGMKFSDTGIDVPILLALLSSFKNIPLPKDMASFGEVSLTGEIRSVQNAEDRIREAIRMGFKQILTPPLNPKKAQELKKLNIKIIECKNLESMINNVF